MILIPERAASLKRKPDPISLVNALLHIAYHYACIVSILNSINRFGKYDGEIDSTNSDITYPVTVKYIYT